MSLLYPKLSDHDPGTQFAEVFVAPGPSEIGQPGNTFKSAFGYAWVLAFSRLDTRLHVYRFNEASNSLEERVGNLPSFPTFNGSERRFSFCFDQSGRFIYAYEGADGVVKITRWEPSQNAYIQNVSFEAVNPCLLMDATLNAKVADSDVLCFYQKDDDSGQVYVRRQRDQYGVETNVTAGIELQNHVLDRVAATPYRWQARLSNDGEVPISFPTSDLYPYGATVTLAGAGDISLELVEAVKRYEGARLELAGAGEIRDIFLISTVTRYSSSLALAGTGEIRGIELIEAVTRYAAAVALAGAGEIDLNLETVATRYEPQQLELAGAGEILISMEDV